MKSKMETMHLTDLVSSLIPGFHICWSQDEENSVLCYKQHTPTDIEFVLVTCDKNTNVEVDIESGVFFTTPQSNIRMDNRHFDLSTMSAEEYDKLPDILKSCITRIKDSSIPKPRTILKKCLVSSKIAREWEQEFYDYYIAPHLSTHKVYAIAHSGTMLCSRLGVKAMPIYANHYNTDNMPDDDALFDIPDFPLPNPDCPILIIDDLVCSGKTAQAVIQRFTEQGFNKIRFVALYNMMADIQIPEIFNYIESYKVVSNAYWYFGRGMDLCSFESRSNKAILGADLRCPGFDKEEHINELRHFFSV